MPIPGQEFVNALGGVVWQAGEHVGKPGLRVDVVELCGGDQAVDGSRASAAFVGAGEGPVLAAQGDGPQLAFRGVVRHAKAPIIQEAGECVPAVEAVVDSFGSVAVLGEPGTLFAQPGLQLDHEWPATFLAHTRALRWREAAPARATRKWRCATRKGKKRRARPPIIISAGRSRAGRSWRSCRTPRVSPRRAST